MFAAEIDVDNCFHRLRIREDLGRHFSLPPLRAGELGICLSGGKVADGLDLIWPCLAVAPMGFTWSLFFVQSINVAKC
jgi:hypothetical protein